MKKKTAALCMLLALCLVMTGCGKAAEPIIATTDYSVAENWAYYAEGEGKEVDLFLICPTVDMNEEFNMSLSDEKTKASFLGALNMERGLYEEQTRMFAPYYRQGADMCYRLLEEYFGEAELFDRLVAVYGIGWPVTEEMTKAYPQIRPAASEDDLGVVISFDCEAPEVTETFINPASQKALSINPLNWKTDGTVADRSENPGSCFTNYDGGISAEGAELCGCYIDTARGVVKVTDVEAAEYPAIVPGLPDGAYHVYDYLFFYRSLQANVALRIERYLAANALDAAA